MPTAMNAISVGTSYDQDRDRQLTALPAAFMRLAADVGGEQRFGGPWRAPDWDSPVLLMQSGGRAIGAICDPYARCGSPADLARSRSMIGRLDLVGHTDYMQRPTRAPAVRRRLVAPRVMTSTGRHSRYSPRERHLRGMSGRAANRVEPC